VNGRNLLDEEVTVEIDIPIDQMPQWLGQALMSGSGASWPFIDLKVERCRFEEPVMLEHGAGAVARIKGTLHARAVEITATE